SHRIAYLLRRQLDAAQEGANSRGRPVLDPPRNSSHRVASADLTQMRFHLFELDTVPQHFDLIDDAAEVVEHAGIVPISQIARQVPRLPVDEWKPRPGGAGIREIALRHLPAG